MSSASEKFLWVCELNKDQTSKKWRAGDLMELEDSEDKDYVINSLVLKTAVLGSKAVDGERNLVAIKTKGYQEQEFEQPIFSLTLGRSDMVSGLDLVLASDHNPEIEFKLVEGSGPVFITCTHLIDLPSQEHPTIMTTSDGDLEDEDIEDEEEEEEAEEEEEDKAKAIKNGLKNGKATNGVSKKSEIEVDEKPTKRRRN